jgi:hypothetical protein
MASFNVIVVGDGITNESHKIIAWVKWRTGAELLLK